MTQTTTTRRDMLRFGTSAAAYAAGAAIVTGGVALASEAKGAIGISPGLAAAIAAFRAAEQAADRHFAAIYQPCRARHEAAITAAKASLPHLSIDMGDSDFASGERVVWSTAEPASVRVAQTIVRIAKEGRGGDRQDIASARKLLAAHLRRQRTIDRVGRSTGVDAVIAENERLYSVSGDAMCAVAAHPVSTAPDLAAKLAFMVEQQMGDGMDWLSELAADAVRVAKAEG